MIYFLISVLVNTIAAAFVLNIVPGLRLNPSFADPLTAVLWLNEEFRGAGALGSANNFRSLQRMC